MGNVLEIIPLGGIGEFGMNCMAVRYDDDIIVIDAGMGFPEESVYGVDVSVPDFDFLEEYRDNITAIILTHGHEDHVGALPYLLRDLARPVPVIGSAFTLELLQGKLEEHDVIVHPGYFFDFERDGYFVVSLLTPPEALAEGISRIV